MVVVLSARGRKEGQERSYFFVVKFQVFEELSRDAIMSATKRPSCHHDTSEYHHKQWKALVDGRLTLAVLEMVSDSACTAFGIVSSCVTSPSRLLAQSQWSQRTHDHERLCGV